VKRYLAVIAATMLISALSALTAFASDYTVIADFDSESAITWSPKDAVSSITTLRDIDTSQNRGKVLSVEGSFADASAIRSVVAEFERPIDLSLYKSLSVSIFADPLSMHERNDCFLRIIINDSWGDHYESIIGLEAGKWEKAVADISSYSNRSSVVSIEFGVVPAHAEIGRWDGGFILDEISAVNKINTALSDRFSFEKYSVWGASLSFAPDKSYLDLEVYESTDSVILEFDVAAIIDPDSNSLRIALENRSDASIIKASLLRTTGEEDVLLAALPKSEEFTVLNLDVRRPSDIKAVKLEFAADGGYIRIYGIEFSSVYGRDSYVTYGEVSECTLSDDSKNIIISGKIPRSNVSAYSDATLLLYSLNLNENARDYDYASATPIASHGMSTKFRFSIPADNGELKKYVVMISSPYMLFVDTPSYVESDILNYEKGALEAGLSNATQLAALESISTSAVVDIYIDKMLSCELSGYLHTIGDDRYYFEKAYIDSIDKKINAYKAAGAEISLRLMIGSDKHSEIVRADSPFIPDSYFPDITTDSGYSKMRACVEFLSERYVPGESGAGVNSFIIGKAVNTSSELFYTSTTSITDFVSSYVDLMRFVYAYSKKHLPETCIYASLGDVYEYSSYENVNNRFDTKLFAQSLYTHIADEGMFPFGICIDSFSGANSHNKILSASDESSLDMLFQSEIFKEQDIPVIFIDHIGYTNISDTGADRSVLSRLLNMAGYTKVKSYIIDCDNASSYTDRIAYAIRSFLCGDTEELSLFGINTEKYNELVSKGQIHKKNISYCDAVYSLPFKPLGKHNYFNTDSYSNIDRILPISGSKEIKLSASRTGKRYLTITADASISDFADQTSVGGVLFFENSKNFTYTPLVSFDLSVSQAESEQSIPVTLRFTGKERIHDVNVTLTGAESQTVYADLSEYNEHPFDSVVILVKDVSSDYTTLSIGSIEGLSGIYSDNELTALVTNLAQDDKSQNRLDPAVISGFIIVLTALSTITLLLFFKSRRNDDDK